MNILYENEYDYVVSLINRGVGNANGSGSATANMA